MARAGNWEVYSNRGLGRAKAWEGKCAGFDLARAGTKLNLCSNSAKPGLVWGGGGGGGGGAGAGGVGGGGLATFSAGTRQEKNEGAKNEG
jgi:hypothetical protein